MIIKKVFLTFLISLLCFFCFAEDSYRLKVESAEDMTVSDSIVSLEGNVIIDFITEDKERSLTADRVIINLDSKTLEALGNVYLSEDSDSSFRGDSLSLNWDTLDVVVFGGTSNSDRTGSQGNSVNFFIVGDRISYSGKNDAVFFQDGTISTRASDPYWSIKAKKIGLAGADIFFSNATLKLGRVPIIWLPVFFYPGNRLSFNPAIGFSSTKGAFFNTTYEIYGSYPYIGSSSAASQDEKKEDEAGALASNFLSFLETKSDKKQIKSGWTYKDLNDTEDLPLLQQWALKTGSYFAVFADAWENYGLSIGYDTKNFLFEKELTIASIGVLAHKADKFRYSLELNGDYSKNDLRLSFKIPFISDPEVRFDLLNRNTVFGLDSVFGSMQNFPSTYSSGLTKYSTYLDGSYSLNKNGFKFKISSLKAEINYKWNSEKAKYLIEDATLPYLSFNASGTIFNFNGESVSKQEPTKLSNKKAQVFLEKYMDIEDLAGDEISDNYFKGKKIDPYTQVETESEYFKSSFSYNQVVDNKYTEKLEQLSLYTKIDASLNTSGLSKNNWIGFTDSLKPVISSNSSKTEKGTTFKLQNVSSVTVPKAGLVYKITNNVYVLDSTKGNTEKRWGRWEKTDVLEHSLGISNKTGHFTYGLNYILPPLDQVLTPSVSYDDGTFASSATVSFSIQRGTPFKPTTAKANASFTNDGLKISISGSNDFKAAEPWKGFKASESITYSLLDNRLKLSQNLTFVNALELNTLSFSANYDKSSIKLSFKNKEIDLDKLDVYLFHDFSPVYYWKSRIGLQGSLDFGFIYDFMNKYNSYLYTDMDFYLVINKFLDLSFSVKSVNNSFYRYYDENGKFSFNTMVNDLADSFDFFGKGRYSTGFNLNSFSLSAIHYLEDWKLTLTSSSHIKTVQGKSVFVPEFSFLVQWNAIPELKTTNTWNKTSGWEK